MVCEPGATEGAVAAPQAPMAGDPQTTVTWFFDGTMDRAENYDSMELALARAEQIRGILERDGWVGYY